MRLYHLIDAIGSYNLEHVFNPWRDVDPLDRFAAHAAQDRRTRLYQHFDCKPRWLLVGEAPGYQGCHFSGVPFTNEKLILDGAVPRVTPPNGLGPRITTRATPWSEPSATIVWRTLHELGIAADVVLWNAFAWHPHKPGELMSNRAPTKSELLTGANILKAVCDHFGSARLIAIGRVAEKALRLLKLTPDAAVRHPSMGGAREFTDGMRRIADRVFF